MRYLEDMGDHGRRIAALVVDWMQEELTIPAGEEVTSMGDQKERESEGSKPRSGDGDRSGAQQPNEGSQQSGGRGDGDSRSGEGGRTSSDKR